MSDTPLPSETLTPGGPMALVIERDRQARIAITAALARVGVDARIVTHPAQAVLLVRERRFAVAFIDRGIGMDMVPELLRTDPGLAVVVTDHRPTIEAAVTAMKAGAVGYLGKPAARGRIRRLLIESGTLATEAPAIPPAWRLIAQTRSPAMRDVLALLRRTVAHDVPVLLSGETGTGKGTLALGLHQFGPRSRRPFVTVQCPSLSPSLLMAELFGHVSGAFTDAVADAPGKVEQAAGGTLLLDEIGDIPLDIQARLLRFLQDRSFERVGDSRPRTADVRILASTSRDLAAEVSAGRFREDLFYRLNIVEAILPPLRERSEDIQLLAEGFLAETAADVENASRSFAPACMAALIAYAWPGNLRELRNEVQRAVVLASGGGEITLGDLSPRVRGSGPPAPRIGGPYPLKLVTDEHIRRVVAKTRTLERAAEVLGIEPSTLWRRRREMQAHPVG